MLRALSSLLSHFSSALLSIPLLLAGMDPPERRPLTQYAVEAYQEFGFWRGSVLTGWRVLRCNPFGAQGYDPPRWPPPRFCGTAS